MPQLQDLAERVERLLLRHQELQRTNALLEQQLAGVTQERDSLRSRLNAMPVAEIEPLLARHGLGGAVEWEPATPPSQAESGA